MGMEGKGPYFWVVWRYEGDEDLKFYGPFDEEWKAHDFVDKSIKRWMTRYPGKDGWGSPEIYQSFSMDKQEVMREYYRDMQGLFPAEDYGRDIYGVPEEE